MAVLALVVGGACSSAGPGPVDAGDRPSDAGSSADAGRTFADAVLDGGYAAFTVEGWNVRFAEPLVTTQRALGQQVLTQLTGDLRTIDTRLAPSASAFLRAGVTVWLEVDQPAFPGGVYHPSESWLTAHGYPAAWAKGVMLGNATNYLDWVHTQPAMLLHELGHAWHDQKLGYADPDVLAAYANAVDGGTYAQVAYANGGTQRAYALTNAQEYFAETTEAWFWRNDFQPFTRTELETFDPTGAALMQAKWP